MKIPGKFTGILTEADIHDERELVRTKWDTPAQIRKWLLQHGFKRLGGGVFSTAYAKPNSRRVVKISLRSDKCWLDYARWAIGLTNNPYVPRISFIKQYEGMRRNTYGRKAKTTFFVTIIERLQPADNGRGLLPNVIKQIDDPVVLAILAHQIGDALNERDHEHIDMRLSELGYSGYHQQNQLIHKNKNHKFAKTLAKIGNLEKYGDECWRDLHSGNLMYRSSTNTLVITDPLASEWS